MDARARLSITFRRRYNTLYGIYIYTSCNHLMRLQQLLEMRRAGGQQASSLAPFRLIIFRLGSRAVNKTLPDAWLTGHSAVTAMIARCFISCAGRRLDNSRSIGFCEVYYRAYKGRYRPNGVGSAADTMPSMCE